MSMSTKHPFLSDGWFAAARSIADKYADDIPEPSVKVQMNNVITDVPFGDGTVRTFVDTSKGQMQVELGTLEKPDVTITLDYDTARKLFVDQDAAAVMQSFMSGKIKVQGAMDKLLAMQATAVPNDAARAAATELKELTE
jgi:putative sterol carrier protein